MESAKPQRRFSWPLAFVLSVLIMALLVGIAVWRMINLPLNAIEQTSEGTKGVVREVRDAFVQIMKIQPTIIVKDRTFFDQAGDIAELATVSQTFQVERESAHSWIGSTKVIRMRGIFEGKAGYDLKEPFVVYVDDPGDGSQKILRLRLPQPRILSVDQKDVEVMRADNGLWNKVQPADVADEANLLHELARKRAAESAMVREAQESLLQQLRDRFGASYKIEVVKEEAPLR